MGRVAILLWGGMVPPGLGAVHRPSPLPSQRRRPCRSPRHTAAARSSLPRTPAPSRSPQFFATPALPLVATPACRHAYKHVYRHAYRCVRTKMFRLSFDTRQISHPALSSIQDFNASHHLIAPLQLRTHSTSPTPSHPPTCFDPLQTPKHVYICLHMPHLGGEEMLLSSRVFLFLILGVLHLLDVRLCDDMCADMRMDACVARFCDEHSGTRIWISPWRRRSWPLLAGRP